MQIFSLNLLLFIYLSKKHIFNTFLYHLKTTLFYYINNYIIVIKECHKDLKISLQTFNKNQMKNQINLSIWKMFQTIKTIHKSLLLKSKTLKIFQRQLIKLMMMKNMKKKLIKVLNNTMMNIDKKTMKKMMKINIKVFHPNFNQH